jgi:hypothetical protein
MLVSYPNVWNTCLLILQQRGYRLFLLGDADDGNSISKCTWNAEKDGMKVRADNPLNFSAWLRFVVTTPAKRWSILVGHRWAERHRGNGVRLARLPLDQVLHLGAAHSSCGWSAADQRLKQTGAAILVLRA